MTTYNIYTWQHTTYIHDNIQHIYMTTYNISFYKSFTSQHTTYVYDNIQHTVYDNIQHTYMTRYNIPYMTTYGADGVSPYTTYNIIYDNIQYYTWQHTWQHTTYIHDNIQHFIFISHLHDNIQHKYMTTYNIRIWQHTGLTGCPV